MSATREAEEMEAPNELKRKTARGAVLSMAWQGASLALRIGSMAIIARLVTPEDFGLVGMVTALTGLLNIFKDGGLPQATVQRTSLEEDLKSTLFWASLAIGVALAGATLLAGPVLARFYGDARLVPITAAIAVTFVLNGASAQHRAQLQRALRFGALVACDAIAILSGIAVGLSMAVGGFGYWALVGMAIAQPAGFMLALWVASGWMPGLPRRGTGAVAMLRYGGLLTLNGAVIYVAYNVDKVLLGRFYGAETLGLYGRAYQLISIPNDNLQAAMGSVMFPALARVQHDPQRLRGYFLKGYGAFLFIVMPTTIACGLFAADIVRVLLGPQWSAAVPIFQLLAPTILVFAILNPMYHLMVATGRPGLSLKIAFLITPTVILGYTLGLPYGPRGVALGFSVAMLLLVWPSASWAIRGTQITATDLLRVTLHPLISSCVGAAVAFGMWMAMGGANVLLRLAVVTAVLFGVHVLTLLFVLNQKEIYFEMLRAIGHGRGAQTKRAGD